MKITKKELSYLLYVLGVLFAIGGIFYSNSLSEQTVTLKAENAVLESEVAYLQDLTNHKQEYLDEMDRMNLEMEDMKNQFPAKILPEDQIMYANNLEAKYEVLLESVDMPGIQNITVDAAAVAPTTTTTTDAAAATTDGTATTTPVQPAATASNTSIALSKATTTFAYQASYPGLKDLVKYVNEDADRKSIESLSIRYDSETGNLTGSFSISMFALDGTGKEYEAPVVTGVTNGKSAIFTGVERLNRSTQSSSDVAIISEEADDTADETIEDNAEETDAE